MYATKIDKLMDNAIDAFLNADIVRLKKLHSQIIDDYTKTKKAENWQVCREEAVKMADMAFETILLTFLDEMKITHFPNARWKSYYVDLYRRKRQKRQV